MKKSPRQGQLFPNDIYSVDKEDSSQRVKLSNDFLMDWQNKIHGFQSKLFNKQELFSKQNCLFQDDLIEEINQLDIISLSPLALNFWRWPNSPHKGPAIYFVTDKPENLNSPLLLYIGETIAAERRWKGEHDCKEYLASYSEALSKANIRYQLTIRFWNDAPFKTKDRQAIEQLLIQKWQPPFNKETRNRWKTPFTSTI